jgi:glycosyltransferase involved in cell wall biosynthesis
MNPCIVIPHYDHLVQFEPMLPRLAALDLQIFVVDDGSPGNQVDRLRELLARQLPAAKLVVHDSNQGKGAAVQTGLRAARLAGYTHAVQVDADGQHDLSDVSDLLSEARAHPASIISGLPRFDEDIPRLRYVMRYLTHVCVWLETLSTDIRDSMCGYRVYPLDQVLALLDASSMGSRMTFDTEILVRAAWRGIGFVHVPVPVSYPESGRSHFRYFQDNVAISWMHTRLITGMFLRLPWLLLQRYTGRQ